MFEQTTLFAAFSCNIDSERGCFETEKPILVRTIHCHHFVMCEYDTDAFLGT